MTSTPTELGIVVGVDGSSCSNDAVRWAAREAVLRRAPITLVHAITPAIMDSDDPRIQVRFTKWQHYHSDRIVDDARDIIAEVAGDQMPEVAAKVLFSRAVPVLADASNGAQMVVVGSRGNGVLTRAFLGSVSAGACHHARCPVVVVHGKAKADDRRPILLGVDGSSASDAAIAFAFDEASRRGVGVVALHAWSDVGAYSIFGPDWHEFRDEAEELLAERLAGRQEQYPDVRVERQLVCDNPAHWLIEEARKAQLVVVGSHGRGGFAGMLLGSVSTAVAESCEVSVVVVRRP